jgi:hypothetical protein
MTQDKSAMLYDSRVRMKFGRITVEFPADFTYSAILWITTILLKHAYFVAFIYLLSLGDVPPLVLLSCVCSPFCIQLIWWSAYRDANLKYDDVVIFKASPWLTPRVMYDEMDMLVLLAREVLSEKESPQTSLDQVVIMGNYYYCLNRHVHPKGIRTDIRPKIDIPV